MDGVFQHGTLEPRQTDAQPVVLFVDLEQTSNVSMEIRNRFILLCDMAQIDNHWHPRWGRQAAEKDQLAEFPCNCTNNYKLKINSASTLRLSSHERWTKSKKIFSKPNNFNAILSQ